MTSSVFRNTRSPSEYVQALIKKDLRRALPEIGSSHLTEAMSAGFGYASHAALPAGFVPHTQPFDERRFCDRLNGFGYTVSPDDELGQRIRGAATETMRAARIPCVEGKTAKDRGVWAIASRCPHCEKIHHHGGGDGIAPDGGHRVSHCVDRTPASSLGYFIGGLDVISLSELRKFKNEKIIKKEANKGIRHTAWRNLMVSTINAALQQGLFTLKSGNFAWKAHSSDRLGQGLFDFDVAGYRAFGYVWDAGFDGLAIHAVIGLKNPAFERTSMLTLRTCDTFGITWMDRHADARMQACVSSFRCRSEIASRLAEIDVQPVGFRV